MNFSNNDNAYFPFFVDVTGMKVKVIGGGSIAARRAEALAGFGADVTVIAPDICEQIQSMYREEKVKILTKRYDKGDIEDAQIVIAATDDEKLNAAIAEECAETDILCSDASNKENCSFYFPGLVRYGDMVIGISSSGRDHAKVKKIREIIEKVLEEV